MSYSTYAETLRLAMHTVSNKTGQEVTLRTLAAATGWSYEHCRRAIKGSSLISKEFNDQVAEFLGLDKDHMWMLAQREKLAKRYGIAVFDMPKDQRIVEAWAKLNDVDRERAIAFIETMAMTSESTANMGVAMHRRRQ